MHEHTEILNNGSSNEYEDELITKIQLGSIETEMFDTNLEFLDSRHEEMNLIQTLKEFENLRK